MNVPFNNKITKLSYENSGLDSPIGSLYDFQSAIVSREDLKPVQPYIIANINNPSENLRVGILTNKANLTFRLSPPSLPFDRPLVENQEDYLFFNYNQIMSMTVVSYLDEPLSKFTYLFDDAPILHSNRVLHPMTIKKLREDTEYIIVSKETSQIYRGKYIYKVDTSLNSGALFEFKLDKLPFFVKIVLSDSCCNFYLNKEASLNKLSQISFIDQERLSLNVDNGRLVNKQRTLRKVRSSLRSRSTTKKPESCITILIVAHGIMDKKIKIDENLMRNVNISLMGGGSDIYGLGGTYYQGSHIIVNNIDNDEIKYTITGDREMTNMSIDMISHIYPYLLDKYNSIKKKCSEQFYIFKEITNYLKKFYELVGIPTFPKKGEFGPNDMGLRDLSLLRQRRIPFTSVTAFNEKKLYFEPNPYQNCRGYGTITRKEDCVLIEPEEKRELSYGITILQSSDPSDENYTLAGISKKGEVYRNATLTDWTQDQTRLYWAQNLVLNTALLPQHLIDYYMDIYDIISNPIDPDGIYDDDNKRYVTLSQVIELFKYGMGFTNVNIIDYSCNTCSTPLTHMERTFIDANASHPTMKLYREIKNEARNRIEDPKEYKQFMMDITNPSTQQIIEVVGEKAKSTSYDKIKKRSRRGKSFGGKNKTKRMKRRHKR